MVLTRQTSYRPPFFPPYSEDPVDVGPERESSEGDFCRSNVQHSGQPVR